MTSRSRRGFPRTAGGSTGWSPCRSGRSPSGGSWPTTTAPRWPSSTSRPSARCRSTELVAALPDEEITFEDAGGFETSDEDYARVVERIISDEIGNGEGANLVVGRHYRAQLRDWDQDRALTVLRRLLTSERGAYWTYCFWTGDRFLIGASPERHVSVHGGDVRMNPISGTFRLARGRGRGAQGPAAGVPGRREGDLRALHGRRRGAEDDVRHLPRRWPGARALPQADDTPGAHGVPPGRAHPLRRPRRPARHDVRRHRHRCAGGERVPADPRLRVRGAGVLRRRARPDRPGRRRCARRRTRRS